MQSDLEGVFKWTRKKENNQEDTNGDTFPGISEKTWGWHGNHNKEPAFSTPAFNEVSCIVTYNNGYHRHMYNLCLIEHNNIPLILG